MSISIRATVVALLCTTAGSVGLAQGGSRGGDAGPACPVALPGTTVRSSETSDGAALTFTTRPANVAKLRERVEQLASMNNKHLARRGRARAVASDSGGGPLTRVPARATVRDIDNGARLVLRPEDPGERDSLVNQVERHASKMKTGECPVWGSDEPEFDLPVEPEVGVPATEQP